MPNRTKYLRLKALARRGKAEHPPKWKQNAEKAIRRIIANEEQRLAAQISQAFYDVATMYKTIRQNCASSLGPISFMVPAPFTSENAEDLIGPVPQVTTVDLTRWNRLVPYSRIKIPNHPTQGKMWQTQLCPKDWESASLQTAYQLRWAFLQKLEATLRALSPEEPGPLYPNEGFIIGRASLYALAQPLHDGRISRYQDRPHLIVEGMDTWTLQEHAVEIVHHYVHIAPNAFRVATAVGPVLVEPHWEKGCVYVELTLGIFANPVKIRKLTR